MSGHTEDHLIDSPAIQLRGLPLMRVRAAKGYVAEKIREEIERRLHPTASASSCETPEPH